MKLRGNAKRLSLSHRAKRLIGVALAAPLIVGGGPAASAMASTVPPPQSVLTELAPSKEQHTQKPVHYSTKPSSVKYRVPVKMQDSSNASAIDTGMPVIAGYVDGHWPWSRQDWNRFPAGTVKLRITVTNNPHANVLDLEPGNYGPEEAHPWLHARERVKGHGPSIIYASAAWIPRIMSMCKGHHYYLWVAEWTGQQHRSFNADIMQWQNDTHGVDLDTVYNVSLLQRLAQNDR